MIELNFLPVSVSTAELLEGSPHFGNDSAETQDNASDGTFLAKIHDAPVALGLRDVFKGKSAETAAALYDRFDLWVVPHRFSLFRKEGRSAIVKIGCEVQYLSKNTTLSVVSMFPTVEFIRVLNGGLQADLRVGLSLDAFGRAEPIDLPKNGASFVAFGTSAKISASSQISGVFKLQLSIGLATPFIAAMGVGSTGCTFEFSRYRDELFNRDIETWAVIALPKYVNETKYKMRCWYTARRFFAAQNWQTEWITLRVKKGAGLIGATAVSG